MSEPEPWHVRLRRLREARGMSRTQLAGACRALGRRSERDDIRHYEAGYHEPRVHTFAALARALGVSMEALLYGEEKAARIAQERASSSR